jgi:alanyl-tRNA synthetase
MATLKSYLAEDSLSACATVTELLENGRIIRLNRTLFHPQGGGQRADSGTIGGVVLTGVRHAGNGEVDHHLSSTLTQGIGSNVELVVDKGERVKNSRYHSAGHLIASAVESFGEGHRAVQGHHWPGEARVEFEGSEFLPTFNSRTLQDTIDRLVKEDLDFQITGDPYSSRALQIGNKIAVPCGGTHVKKSSELIGLLIVKMKVQKNLLRVSYTI